MTAWCPLPRQGYYKLSAIERQLLSSSLRSSDYLIVALKPDQVIKNGVLGTFLVVPSSTEPHLKLLLVVLVDHVAGSGNQQHFSQGELMSKLRL